MIAYIALGSNLDNPSMQLAVAVTHIGKISNTQLLDISKIYLTAPIGGCEQPDFLNQVVSVETGLSAQQLLLALQSIEHTMGRVRTVHWGPRVIDCDILLYGNQVIETADLSVPHPRMTERAFVLYPLRDIAPGLVLPSGEMIADLCTQVADQEIHQYEVIS